MKSKILLTSVSAIMALMLAMSSIALAESGSSGDSGGSSGVSSSDDMSGRSSDSPRSSDDSSSSGLEVEIEHGITILKPHGGAETARIGEIEHDSGMEVEIEHGVAFLKPHGGAKVAADVALANRLSGRILLQVEKHGEAWFVDPATKKVAFLGRPADALQAMREFGLGITNDDLAKIAVADTQGRGDDRMAARLAGRILLQVEDKGQAWWVDPVSHKRHSLGRPHEALELMKNKGLGISDDNLAKLAGIR